MYMQIKIIPISLAIERAILTNVRICSTIAGEQSLVENGNN